MSCLKLVAIGLHLASIHTHAPSNPDYGPVYNNNNPGVYASTECGLTGGVYYNSIGKMTAHVGYNYDAKALPVFVSAAIATGYDAFPVVPIVMAGVYASHKGYRLRVGFIPKVGKTNDTNVFHLMVEKRF